MQSRNVVTASGIFVFCVAVFATLALNDFSGYTDAGIHYAFSEELARTRQWPLPLSSSMAGIAHYPPASHFASILIGLVPGSSLYGIFFLAAASFAASYLALAELMRQESPLKTCLAYAIFVTVSLVGRPGRFFEGNEIVGNFFFAQFAGTAALLASFLAISKITYSRFAHRLLLSAVCTHIVGWIYTVSAIELALSCVALEFLVCLRSLSLRSIASLLGSALILGAAALLHPTIIGSVDIAANDGGISVTLPILITGCTALTLGIAVLGWFRRPVLVNHDALIALSLGMLAACFLQAFAFAALNLGSLYAIKKYGFLLGTLAVAVWASLVADMLAKRSLKTAISSLPASIFGIACLLTVTAARPKTPLRELIAYDREVRTLTVAYPELLHETVSWNSTVTAHINYTIGLGVLQPKQFMDQHAVFLPKPVFSGSAQNVVVEAKAAQEFDSACIVGATENVIAVRSKCFLRSPRSGKTGQ